MSKKWIIIILTIFASIYALGRADSPADAAFMLLVAVPISVAVIGSIVIWFLRSGEAELKRRQAELEEKERRIRAIEIADVDNMLGLEFEHYVAKLMQSQGYQARVTKGSGDLGVDILAERNSIKYAVQVKRHAKQISRRAGSDAVAGKIHFQCDSCMVITNSYFSSGAKQMSQSTGCELIDRDTLINWIIAFQSTQPVITLDDVIRNEQSSDSGSLSVRSRSRRGGSTVSSFKKSYRAHIKKPTYSSSSRRSKKKWW